LAAEAKPGLSRKEEGAVPKERWAAEQRAQDLLRSWLSPDQRRQYDEQESFDVVGGDTGRRYRIHKGIIFNIQELDDRGVQISSLCVAADRIPTGDINLAQKIALETFENGVLAVANRTCGIVWPTEQSSARRR
jgi:hypothetical protein